LYQTHRGQQGEAAMSRLETLQFQIPILEEKLRSMKRERRRLVSAETMRAKWADSTFRAATIAAVKLAQKAGRSHRLPPRFNVENQLPWPHGTRERNKYRSLTRKGWTRELAIEKIRMGQ
jgi:hypothetical protein